MRSDRHSAFANIDMFVTFRSCFSQMVYYFREICSHLGTQPRVCPLLTRTTGSDMRFRFRPATPVESKNRLRLMRLVRLLWHLIWVEYFDSYDNVCGNVTVGCNSSSSRGTINASPRYHGFTGPCILIRCNKCPLLGNQFVNLFHHILIWRDACSTTNSDDACAWCIWPI